jgi:hypothetical protein
MKALITKVEFQKEYESKYGTLFAFKVSYDDKTSYYSSKKKDQTNFVEGKEAEFTEEVRQGEKGEYTVIKPLRLTGQMSNFGRQLKKEQSRYSGFAMAYSKDLVVGGRIQIADMYPEAERMFNFMVALDKSLES